MPMKSKSVHEAFTRFFESPSRETLRTLLKEHVGELRACDFKEIWPNNPSLAKHLLAIGNAEGGCLVVGVRENPDKSLTAQGVRDIRDKADFFNGVKAYVPARLLAAIEIADFSFAASEYSELIGKAFQVVFIHPRTAELPFVAQRAGEGIRGGAIYVRREGQSEEGTHEEVQAVIAKRLASAPTTSTARGLKEHLEELKILYAEIPRYLGGPFSAFSEDMERLARSMTGDNRSNPQYPKEDYQAFVRRLLDAKKLLIHQLTTSAERS
jgi:hypothetical protein